MSIKISAAKALTEESYRVVGGFKIIDRFFEVPLDHSKGQDSESIRIFARSAIPNKKNDNGEEGGKLPYFLYLQGGPGHECGAPKSMNLTQWLFDKGYQVLYLDQRGTGLSTPISAATLAKRGDTEAQADYVKLFRADNIVRDAEAIRLALLGNKEKEEERKWSVIGQSFGGFCATTYLSFYPEGLKEVFTTGGMPPLVSQPDAIYERTFKKVVHRNKLYYEKFPQDVKRVRDIISHLASNNVVLSNGGKLTPARFLDLGINFGSPGGIDNIHMWVQRAANELEIFGELTTKMLQTIQAQQPYDGNPIYAIAHEAIYCQGEASKWSAERMKTEKNFDWEAVAKKGDEEPVYFTGEMIFPSMFNDYTELRGPLKSVAELLAQDTDWPPLYDPEQLRKNEVPVFAATYMEDMYVDFDFARETAATIKGCKEFINNTMFHGALRSETEKVLSELWKLKIGEVE